MEKTTLNPFENAKRTAQGGGGVSPSVIEEIQEEISVLGSENRTQTQDITDIKAQLEELVGAYSNTEHKTGRKWTNGKNIYEKTFTFTPSSAEGYVELSTPMDTVISIVGTLHDETSDNYFDINSYLTSSAFMYAYINVNDSKLMFKIPSNLVNMTHAFTVQYTKPTV